MWIVSKVKALGLTCEIHSVPVPHFNCGVGCVGPNGEIRVLGRHAAVGPDSIESIDHNRLGVSPNDLPFSSEREQRLLVLSCRCTFGPLAEPV